METNVIEIFSSVQGEGKYVGCRQLFVRFEGCNLDCQFCDTENTPGTHPICEIETYPGSRRFSQAINPLEASEVAAYINRFITEVPHQAISLTGGEPLLQSAFIKEMLSLVNGCSVMLETNGTLPDRLASIIDYIDIISMDIKLPQMIGKEYWAQHKRFLEIASSKDVYVKLVAPVNIDMDDFQRSVDMVCCVNEAIPFILQPVTPMNGVESPSPELMLELQQQALEKLSDVRVIPQTHRMMNQL